MSSSAGLICAIAYIVIYVVDYLTSWQAIQRPIVVAPIIGFLLGDFQTGIIMGASLEAIFMGISAVGGSVPSDCLSGSIIAVAYAILVGGDEAVDTGLALAMTIGTIMTSISSIFTALWASLSAYWENLAAECKPNKFLAMNLLVMVLSAIPNGVIIYFGVSVGVDVLDSALAACPAWVLTGLSAAGTMMTAVGFGILLSQIWSADIAVWYFVGFVLAESLGLSSLGVAIVAAAIALFYFFIERDIVEHGVASSSDTGEGAAAPELKAANTEEDFF